ncbi:MAG: Fic family protein [Acidobacteria bacterium]|nr:Fic family protein [Acidobacteriota bacterium]
MLLEMLRIRDDSGLVRLLQATGDVERSLSQLEAINPNTYGSIIAPEVLSQSVAGSAVMAGFAVTESQVARVISGEDPALDQPALAAVRGLVDALRTVLGRPGELPLSESQLKYLQSLLLRHEPAAALFRRQYRREGEDAATIAGRVAHLVAWARTNVDQAASVESGLLRPPVRPAPFLVVAVFAGRLLEIRPFAVGNGRLARIVTAQLLALCGYHFLAHSPIEPALAERAAAMASATESGNTLAWVEAFLEALASCARAAAKVAAVERPDRDRSPAPGPFLLTPRQERIAAAMRERGAAKIGELLTALEIPRATLKKDLRGLIGAGVLSATGVRKGTVYRVLPEARAAD